MHFYMHVLCLVSTLLFSQSFVTGTPQLNLGTPFNLNGRQGQDEGQRLQPAAARPNVYVKGHKTQHVLVLSSQNASQAIFPIVNSELGNLIGKTDVSRSGRYFYAFYGIPYAEPVKRFQPSVLVQPWSTTLDARTPGASCPQPGPGGASKMKGNETCLFLNVFYPHEDLCKKESENGKLPVLFYIHGGGFTGGAGTDFNAKYLLDECVVLVTINYRLGVLGFLTTDDGIIPGNLGLKDQITALQWVQKYIGEFRGDKDLVTIFGVSAGGSSVSHLVASPMAKGLIHRAIAQSGVALNPWSISEKPGVVAQNVGKALKCPTDSTEKLKECLEKKSVKELVNVPVAGFIAIAPVVEPATAVNPFQTENPAKRLRSGDFNQIPMITGFTQDEGILLLASSILSNSQTVDNVNKYWNAYAPGMFLYDNLGFSQEKMDNISKSIREFYFKEQLVSLDTRQNLVDLYSDRLFVQGIFETVELQSKYSPVYPYVMSYKGGNSLANFAGYHIPASTHGDEMQFLMHAHNFLYGSEQVEFSRNLVSLWTSFAKTGKPVGTAPTLDTWPAATSGGRANSKWFALDHPTRVESDYLEERRKFWESTGIYEVELQ